MSFFSVRYYLSGRLSQHLLLLAAVAGTVGLLSARFLVALAPVVGVLAVLANPRALRDWRLYPRNWAALRAAAIPAFLLLSGLYTSSWFIWRHELFRSLTWLGVPLAFALAVPLAPRQRLLVGALFVLGTAAVGLATLGQYLLHPWAANEAIRIGQNMEAITRIFHVPFGLMLAQAFFWSLLLRRDALAGRWLRWALLGAAVAAVVTLHVLAYRTGLVVLYAGAAGYVGWLLLVRRQWAIGLGILLLVGLGPWLAYQSLESVQKRVGASVWDVQQYTQGNDINNYSLARRLAAIETASNIVGQHLLLGVGPADTHEALMAQYQWHDFGLKPANRVEVHNQYLEALLGGGIVGLFLLMAVLFGPLERPQLRRDPYILFFILTQATVMMTADMFSLQTGLNLFVFEYGFLVVAQVRRHLAG